MRVLMQNRSDAFKNKGGDTIQMLKTKENLEKLGVEVDISLELEPNLDGYDIIHLFNISRVDETWIQFKNAKRQNKKVVISTIYHSKKQIRDYEENGINNKIINLIKDENKIQSLKTLARIIYSRGNFNTFFRQIRRGYVNQQKDIINNADMILPNSNMELEFIVDELNLDVGKIKYYVIPNGVELNITNIESTNKSINRKYAYKDFIFCAGRIEPLKNQIKLIEALDKTNYSIVFAGGINKKHKKYYKKFMSMVEKNEKIHYLGLVDKNEMNNLYRAAKITILPSWFETTGLTGIESIYQGTPAIVTNRGYTKEYYSDYVVYCDPSDSDSIRDSIESAKDKVVDYELIKLINEKFNWKRATEITLDAYKKIYENN